MYSPTDRKRLSERLIAAAHADDRIQGVAVTGSGAVDSTDAWSDIDVAFGLRPGVDRTETVDDWTRRMYRDHRAVHHTDVMARNTVYRVFLLADTLQVDIAFAPDGSSGPPLRRFGFCRVPPRHNRPPPCRRPRRSSVWRGFTDCTSVPAWRGEDRGRPTTC